MVGGNNIFKQNNKSWAVILGVLMLAIVGLVAAIVIININHEEELKRQEEERIQEEIALDNAVTEQCNTVRESYESGAIPLDVAEQYFENQIKEETTDAHKAFTIRCYSEFVYDAGEGITAAVAIADRLKTLSEDDGMLMNYYITLRDLYEKDGNEEMSDYYGGLMGNLNQEMEGEE